MQSILRAIIVLFYNLRKMDNRHCSIRLNVGHESHTRMVQGFCDSSHLTSFDIRHSAAENRLCKKLRGRTRRGSEVNTASTYLRIG